MAPLDKNKYENWTFEELMSECTKREIDIKEGSSNGDLVKALLQDDEKPSDWGRVYAAILYHTGMEYEEIARRTIPQIKAILGGAEENIPIKMGISNIFGSTSLSQSAIEAESSQEDVEAFFNSF